MSRLTEYNRFAFHSIRILDHRNIDQVRWVMNAMDIHDRQLEALVYNQFQFHSENIQHCIDTSRIPSKLYLEDNYSSFLDSMKMMSFHFDSSILCQLVLILLPPVVLILPPAQPFLLYLLLVLIPPAISVSLLEGYQNADMVC